MSVDFAVAQLVARSIDGPIIEGAEFRVYNVGVAGANDGLASIFDDAGDAVDQSTDPLLSDANGLVRFRAAAGVYNIEAEIEGTTSYWKGYRLGTAQARDVGSSAAHLPSVADLSDALDALAVADTTAPTQVIVLQDGTWKRATLAQLDGWLAAL